MSEKHLSVEVSGLSDRASDGARFAVRMRILIGRVETTTLALYFDGRENTIHTDSHHSHPAFLDYCAKHMGNPLNHMSREECYLAVGLAVESTGVLDENTVILPARFIQEYNFHPHSEHPEVHKRSKYHVTSIIPVKL